MKSKQFCSVCKDWLEMEVVPTGDGDDDDGVIWFRCPQCQGFLPKLSGGDLQPEADAEADAESGTAPDGPTDADADTAGSDDMPWDSPAEMMAAQEPDDAAEAETAADPVEPTADPIDIPGGEFLLEEAARIEPEAEAAESGDGPPAEPVHEYAAMLAAADVSTSTPYRPWETYEQGQCIHHLAWDDCGVVVQKEDLPGGRKVIKCYFEEAGVVRLIEQAPR